MGLSIRRIIAGAIVEHLSDPVYSIGAWSRIAREAVIIPWTDIIPANDLFMRPITPWTDPAFFYAWWQLSEGLWRRSSIMLVSISVIRWRMRVITRT